MGAIVAGSPYSSRWGFSNTSLCCACKTVLAAPNNTPRTKASIRFGFRVREKLEPQTRAQTAPAPPAADLVPEINSRYVWFTQSFITTSLVTGGKPAYLTQCNCDEVRSGSQNQRQTAPERPAVSAVEENSRSFAAHWDDMPGCSHSEESRAGTQERHWFTHSPSARRPHTYQLLCNPVKVQVPNTLPRCSSDCPCRSCP
jgi:hypothetical protein